MIRMTSVWALPLLIASTAFAADGDLAKRYTDLAKQLDTEQRNFGSALYRAKTREQTRAAWELKPNNRVYVSKMLELARTDRKSPQAFGAADFIIKSSPGSEEADEAFRILIEHHLDKKSLKGAKRLSATGRARQA